MKTQHQFNTYLFLICCLIYKTALYSQSSLDSKFYVHSILNLEYDSIRNELSKNDHTLVLSQINSLAHVLYKSGQHPHRPLQIIEHPSTTEIKIFNLLQWGYYRLYYHPDDPEILTHFLNAYNASNGLNKKHLRKLCLFAILEFYHFEYAQTHTRYKKYLQEFQSLAEYPIEKCWSDLFQIYFLYQSIQESDDQQIDAAFIQLETAIKALPEDHNFHILFNSIKAIHLEYSLHLDQAFKMHESVIQKSKNKPFFNYLSFRSYIRLSEIYYQHKDYEKGLEAIQMAAHHIDKSNPLKDSIYISKYSSKHYAALKNYPKAYEQLNTSVNKQYILDYKDNNLHNSSLEIELQTAEKENQLFKEQQKNKQQRTLAIVLASLVILVAIIGYLLQKNAKRKQLIAEQDKALESQKLSTVLKEQELKSLDAMIAGQEKERQRIANDLHDDLGSLMATIKLHISALKGNASIQLFDKTLDLVDTTYNKIRNISHENGSGLLANKSLLTAIHDMANSASISKNLDIKVIDYGLDYPLDNSLELTLFRIIQELITNILKHANAKEATIHITQYDKHLNIMIEDNGQGFDPKSLSQNSGMGIHSIDRRVDSLGGTITIESEIHKGTTVIIDIPFHGLD